MRSWEIRRFLLFKNKVYGLENLGVLSFISLLGEDEEEAGRRREFLEIISTNGHTPEEYMRYN